MISFIENIYYENKLTMTRKDMKKPLNAIGVANVRTETMLSTLDKHIKENHIGYIEYSVKGNKSQSKKPLNEFFCDNIIVFILIEDKYLCN